MQQAQALQDKLKEMQAQAAEQTVEAESGGGMVRVTVDGAMRVRKIEIDAALLGRQRQVDARRPDRGRGQRRANDARKRWSPKRWASSVRSADCKFPGFGND